MATGSLNLYGRKIYLLGTSDLGPVNTPIKIQSASHVKQIFGEQGTLLDAYRVIRESDFNCDVYMVKVSGMHSELYLDINVAGGEIIHNGFYMKAKSANDMFDNIEIIIESDALYINYTTDEIGNYTLEYKYHMEDEYGNPVYDSSGNLIFKTLYDLAEEINEDTRNLVSQVYCYANCEPGVMSNSALIGVNDRENMLSGGNSGLYYNKNMLYNCLSDTYAILEGRDIDIILPLGCYFDDTYTSDVDALELYYNFDREYLNLSEDGEWVSYYKQLLEFCKIQMRFGYMTHGIMGMNRLDNPFIDQESYYELLTHFKKINEDDKEYDKYRQLVSVCVGDLYSTFGTRVYNSYIAYASLVANLRITKNTTNQPLPDSFTTFIDFEQRMLNKIKDLGYTAFRYSVLKDTVVCANGVTTSEDKAFKYFCNMRMCQLTMCKVRELLMSYIGENINSLIETREIEQSVINLMNQLVVNKVLTGFGINSISNPNTGHLMLDISFKTQYMLEMIPAYSGLTTVRYGDNYGQ